MEDRRETTGPRSALLKGKRGLIAGIANKRSIAAGCAEAFADAGASLILTYQGEKALPHVAPVGEVVGAEALLALDVTDEEETARAFEAVAERWGRLDFLVHSIAFCPKADLHASVVDCSREGLRIAMDVSCHSLIRMTRLAAPLMSEGGSILTFSYHGAEKVVDHYNIMGPVKAALEASVRYLAAELGERRIRVNAISPGPIATRAASGIASFDELMADAVARAPKRRLATIGEVGALAAFLVSDPAAAITGGVHYVDCGLNTIA